MFFEKNTFYLNNATSEDVEAYPSEGGAIYYTCGGFLTCSVELSGNTFKNNTAGNAGGAIKWFDVEPKGLEDEDNNQFIDNKAIVYGDDIASFPRNIILLTEEEF